MEDCGFLMNPLSSLEKMNENPLSLGSKYHLNDEIVGGFSARMVGYAASAIPQDSDIPWQRVINYKGGISQRRSVTGRLHQKKLLEEEGIVFNQFGRTDLDYYR